MLLLTRCSSPPARADKQEKNLIRPGQVIIQRQPVPGLGRYGQYHMEARQARMHLCTWILQVPRRINTNLINPSHLGARPLAQGRNRTTHGPTLCSHRHLQHTNIFFCLSQLLLRTGATPIFAVGGIRSACERSASPRRRRPMQIVSHAPATATKC